MEAKRLPLSTNMPINDNRVCDGSLNGKGIKASRKLLPGASTSRNSPGWMGSASSRIRMPLVLKPAGKLAKVPASIN